MTGASSSLGLLADELEFAAEWRESKAAEFPNDQRNASAASLLRRLMVEVRELEGTPLAQLYNEHIRCMPDSLMVRYSEHEVALRDRIGFDHFPENGEELVRQLLEVRAILRQFELPLPPSVAAGALLGPAGRWMAPRGTSGVGASVGTDA